MENIRETKPVRMTPIEKREFYKELLALARKD